MCILNISFEVVLVVFSITLPASLQLFKWLLRNVFISSFLYSFNSHRLFFSSLSGLGLFMSCLFTSVVFYFSLSFLYSKWNIKIILQWNVSFIWGDFVILLSHFPLGLLFISLILIYFSRRSKHHKKIHVSFPALSPHP